MLSRMTQTKMGKISSPSTKTSCHRNIRRLGQELSSSTGFGLSSASPTTSSFSALFQRYPTAKYTRSLTKIRISSSHSANQTTGATHLTTMAGSSHSTSSFAYTWQYRRTRCGLGYLKFARAASSWTALTISGRVTFRISLQPSWF